MTRQENERERKIVFSVDFFDEVDINSVIYMLHERMMMVMSRFISYGTFGCTTASLQIPFL